MTKNGKKQTTMFGNKSPIIIESTTTHTTTTRTIKVSNEIMGKLQKASGTEYNINFNVKDDIALEKSRFNPFEQKTNHKFRG